MFFPVCKRVKGVTIYYNYVVIYIYIIWLRLYLPFLQWAVKEVPRMAVLFCNGRALQQNLPIHLQSRALVNKHTLAPFILPLLEEPDKGFFWICWSLAIAFNLMSSMVEAHFQSR
jgi:hypothetical protein